MATRRAKTRTKRRGGDERPARKPAAKRPTRRKDLGPRDRILGAAAECFARRGYAQTRMVAIADAAGISRAGLYKRFPSKESLLLAFLDSVIDGWRRWTEETLALETGAREAIARWLREGLADPWHVNTAHVLSSEDTQADLMADAGATTRALRETHRALVRVLERGVASGELRADLDVDVTARSLQVLLLGLLRTRAATRPALSLARRRELDGVVELIVHGIAAPER